MLWQMKRSEQPRPESCCLTLGAGDSGSVASASFGAAEVSSVMQAVGQRHLCPGAADTTHHHSVCTHRSRPVPRLLWKSRADIRMTCNYPLGPFHFTISFMGSPGPFTISVGRFSSTAKQELNLTNKIIIIKISQRKASRTENTVLLAVLSL